MYIFQADLGVNCFNVINDGNSSDQRPHNFQITPPQTRVPDWSLTVTVHSGKLTLFV